MSDTSATNTQSQSDVTPPRMLTAQRPLAILFSAIGLGFAFDRLFYGHLPGISVVLFFALYAAVFAFVAVRNRTTIRFENLWPLPVILFFAAMVAIRENEFLTVVNVLAVFSGLLFLPFYVAAGSFARITLPGGALIPVRVGASALVQLGNFWPQVRAAGAGSEPGGSTFTRVFAHWGGVFRGLLLSLPILLVFGALLASADQIFAETLGKIFSLDVIDLLLSAIGSTLRVTILACLAGGALVYAFLCRPTHGEKTEFESELDGLADSLRIGFVESTTVLALVNVLFGAFVAIQLGYLFGGGEYISTAQDFTYADYARSGFFELVITAVLSLFFVVIVQRMSRRTGAGQNRWFNALGSLLLAFVMVMLVSAYRRMALYEATYGYTELRLLVYVFIAWLAVLLVWMIGALWLRPERATLGMVVAALGFLTTLNLLNPDAFIVRRNVERHLSLQNHQQLPEQSPAHETVAAAPPSEGRSNNETRGSFFREDIALDLGYLRELSNDAVPELLRARDRLKQDPDAVARLNEILAERGRQITDQRKKYADWQSWHYGRARSYELLQTTANHRP